MSYLVYAFVNPFVLISRAVPSLCKLLSPLFHRCYLQRLLTSNKSSYTEKVLEPTRSFYQLINNTGPKLGPATGYEQSPIPDTVQNITPLYSLAFRASI